MNSQKGNPGAEPKEGRVDPRWPKTTSVHDRNSRQIRLSSWLVNCHFIGRHTGLLNTFEGLLELEYNTRVLLFPSSRCVHVSEDIYRWASLYMYGM